MTPAFTDYHCHLLPAVDDGAVDLDETLSIAAVLARFGFARVHCTPHHLPGLYESDPARVRRGVATLQERLEGEGIELRLVPGTEYCLDHVLASQVENAITFGSSRLLLVEAPFRSDAAFVSPLLLELVGKGVRPLVAHPERCSAFYGQGWGTRLRAMLPGRRLECEQQESLLRKLKEAGCAFQGNIGSFAGVYGAEVQQRAVQFLKDAIYSCLGSDAHRAPRLEAVLSEGLAVLTAAVGDAAAFRLLTGAELEEGTF